MTSTLCNICYDRWITHDFWQVMRTNWRCWTLVESLSVCCLYCLTRTTLYAETHAWLWLASADTVSSLYMSYFLSLYCSAVCLAVAGKMAICFPTGPIFIFFIYCLVSLGPNNSWGLLQIGLRNQSTESTLWPILTLAVDLSPFQPMRGHSGRWPVSNHRSQNSAHYMIAANDISCLSAQCKEYGTRQVWYFVYLR